MQDIVCCYCWLVLGLHSWNPLARCWNASEMIVTIVPYAYWWCDVCLFYLLIFYLWAKANKSLFLLFVKWIVMQKAYLSVVCVCNDGCNYPWVYVCVCVCVCVRVCVCVYSGAHPIPGILTSASRRCGRGTVVDHGSDDRIPPGWHADRFWVLRADCEGQFTAAAGTIQTGGWLRIHPAQVVDSHHLCCWGCDGNSIQLVNPSIAQLEYYMFLWKNHIVM